MRDEEGISPGESPSGQRATESATGCNVESEPCGTVFDIGPFAAEGSLLDRKSGEQAGAALLEAMRQLPMQGVLIANCYGLRHATYPGLASMLFGFPPPRRGELRDRYLILRIHSSQDEFSEAMEHVAREMGMIVPTIDEEGRRRLYGKLTVAEAQTMALVQAVAGGHDCSGDVPGVTAAVLSEQLNIPVSAASTRLKHLFDRGLLRREEHLRSVGGREFFYWPLSAKR